MALVPTSNGAETFFRSRAPKSLAAQARPDEDPQFPATDLGTETLQSGSAAFFGRVRQEEDDAVIRFRAASKANPDLAAKANRLSRWTGTPADTIERNMAEVEGDVRASAATAALRDNPRLLKHFADPRNAAAASDDVPTMKRISDNFRAFWGGKDDAITAGVRVRADRESKAAQEADGWFDRLAASAKSGLSNLEAGLFAVGGALRDWSANNPLPWTSAENIEADRAAAGQLRTRARLLSGTAPIRGATSWAQVKAAPTPGNVGAFIAEQGAASVPGMAAAAFALPGYIASQAGSIGQQRARNDGRQDADLADVIKAAPAAVASSILERVGINKIFHAGGSTVARRIAGAAAGEASTEFAQSAVEYAGGTVGTDAGFKWREALDQGLAGAVAGAGMGATFRSVQEGVRASTEGYVKTRQAQAGADMVDRIMAGAAESKLRQRDPDGFADFVAAQAAGTAVENIYVPAETLRQLYQDQGLDWNADDGILAGVAPDFREQMQQGLAAGGDVVIPIAQAAAHLAGTPEWEIIRDHVRVSPGGLSPFEAQSYEDAYAELMTQRGEEAAAIAAQELEEMAPRQRVYEDVLGQARSVGFSLNAARAYADLWAERYQTRSERLGDGRTAWDLFEQSFAGIQQATPDSLLGYGRGDELDVLVNAMRRNAEATKPAGPSLLEWIAKRGGIEDAGGDVASMGGDRWHKDKAFRKRLIRDTSADGQADMLGGRQSINGPDVMFRDAVDAGFFPELAAAENAGEDIDGKALLFEAIERELRGDPIYAGEIHGMSDVDTQSAIAQAAEDLRAMLENAGLDPETASKAEIAQAMTAAQLDEQADRSFSQRVKEFLQGKEQTAKRGRIDFLLDGRAAITLFEGRDLSTLLHEGGHLWLEELRSDALAAGGGRLADDWGKIKKWFGENGVVVDDGANIPTEAHELWARGMERFFMEGKPPSAQLRGAFANFRAWLLRIYQVVSRLNSNITPDVRGVMERLIATDSAVAWAIHEADQKLMFDSAAAANMTGAEYNAYRQLLDDSRTEAMDALLYRTMERIRRSRTAEYQEQERRVRADVVAEIDKRPEVRALYMLRGMNGETYAPIDRQALIDMIGKDGLSLMPFGRAGQPAVRQGGMSPDLMAELVGFRDGRELVNALIGMENRRKELVASGDKRSPVDEAIDIETDRIMAERHGDIFDDGTIEEEALAEIHNDKAAELLATEVRQLARKVGEVPSPLSAVKAWAERVVREGKIVDQASGAAIARHQRAERMAAQAAERAYLGGDTQTAFVEKQKQMVASALYRAAKDAKDKVDVIARRLDRLARAKTLKGMDQDYLDRIHQLLEQYDLKKRSAADIKERESFDKWAKRMEEQGVEVFVPERLTMAGNVNFTRLTYDDITALDDAVQSLAHLGREKKSLMLAKEERDFEALIQEAEQTAMTLPKRRSTQARNVDPKLGKQVDAMLTKVEFLADQLDGNNPNGVFNRILVQEATRAANEKERLVRDVVDPLAQLYLNMPKAQQRRLAARVAVPEFVQRNLQNGLWEPTVFSRMELVAVALNMGNKSNLEKMLIGETLQLPEMLRGQFGWTQEKVMAVLDRELAAEDWQFVQKVWDQINTLWPDIARSEREITGIVPEKIEAAPVVTRHGTFAGGYYPMVYDPARSQIAADNLDGDAERLMGQMGRSVATPKGHTITRTEAALPVHFSVERVLLNHINRVATRIAYGRYVRDALKFIANPRIRKIVDEHAGLEYHKQLKPWLQRQVNEAALDTNTLSGLDWVLRASRVNATVVGLGFRVTTMVSQISGWNNSAAFLGPKYLMKGMAETVRNLGSIRIWVFDQSPEMASRAQSFDRDVRTFFSDLQRASTRERGGVRGVAMKIDDALHLDKARAWAFWGIGMIDVYLVSMPTWVGAYHKGVDEGMSIAQARAYADKAVRETQGAGRAKDLAAIQAGPEATKIFTTFYSYFNVLYNQQRATLHAARSGDWRRAAMNVFWIMMAGPLASALLTGDTPGEDEDAITWALRKIFFGLWGGIPLVRDIASVTERQLAGKFAGEIQAPFYRAFNELERPINDAIRAAKGEDVSDRWLRNAITPVGYFTGLPTGQIGATAQYGYDVSRGYQSPEDLGDVAMGISKGPQEDQE